MEVRKTEKYREKKARKLIKITKMAERRLELEDRSKMAKTRKAVCRVTGRKIKEKTHV